jgi:hypothetical protein
MEGPHGLPAPLLADDPGDKGGRLVGTRPTCVDLSFFQLSSCEEETAQEDTPAWRRCASGSPSARIRPHLDGERRIPFDEDRIFRRDRELDG